MSTKWYWNSGHAYRCWFWTNSRSDYQQSFNIIFFLFFLILNGIKLSPSRVKFNVTFLEDMLLLDISDSGSQSAEGDQLISDFLGSKAVPDNPYYGSDLLSGFMIESMNNDQNSTALESQNSATQDLLSIFQEHDDAMREAKNNPQGQSCWTKFFECMMPVFANFKSINPWSPCTFHRTGSRYETVWALNSELRGSVLAKHGFILIYYVARKELKPRRLFFNFIQLKLVKLWLSMSFSFLVYLSSVFSSFVNFFECLLLHVGINIFVLYSS